MRCDEMPQVDVTARMEGSTCCGWAAWPEGGSALEVRQWGWSFFPFAACRCLCRRGEQTLIMGILNVTPDWLANALQCLQIGFDSAEVFFWTLACTIFRAEDSFSDGGDHFQTPQAVDDSDVRKQVELAKLSWSRPGSGSEGDDCSAQPELVDKVCEFRLLFLVGMSK